MTEYNPSCIVRDMANRHLVKAVKLAGGQAPLARKLSERLNRPFKQAHVWNWLHRDGAPLPAEVVIPIEEITDGQVTRHQLRPDIYPIEPQQQAAN